MASFVLSIFVNIGMWFERFVITVTSLHRDALPSSWEYFVPVTELLLFGEVFGVLNHPASVQDTKDRAEQLRSNWKRN